MSNHVPNHPRARVISLRPATAASSAPAPGSAARDAARERTAERAPAPARPAGPAAPEVREPLWRDVVGDVLRRERLAQERTLKDVAEAARISMPYLSEVERGRKEASSEVLAAAAQALGLGLADLLGLVQGELAEHARAAHRRRARRAAVTSVTSMSRVTSVGSGRHGGAPAGTRHDGVCLAA
ncbi:helix-turn-helix domain-containing protein [Streptomyces sp. NPDC018031]|uniref:helix-turn-helix domain-containing protein n=1 Tax=Streptomyces sp. NPDC018031 TaxID=3365033 RepID=UPI0037B2489C